MNIVAPRGEIQAGLKAQCDVIAAGRVVKERLIPVGHVPVAGCVALERLQTGGRVLEAGGVAKERT